MARACAGGVAVLLAGCGAGSSPWLAGTNAHAAEDQIMLVRAEPPSFGFRRLMHEAREYPDLSVFLRQRGVPDFLAETTNDDRHYLILYYLERRQAFACRTRTSRRSIEFAGPYPITPREVELLRGFRQQAARRLAALDAAGA